MAFFFFFFFLIVINCQVKEKSSINNNKRDLQNNEYTNIRIEVATNCIFSSPSTINIDLLLEGIEKAKETIQKLVKVQRFSEILSLSSYYDEFPPDFRTCSIFQNIDDLKKAYRADLVIAIKFQDDDSNIGFAKPSIIQRDDSGRPIIGTIIYNRNFLQDIEDESEKREAISVIFLHEFTHILGFTKGILEEKHLLLSVPNKKNRMNQNTQTKLYVNGNNVKKKAIEYFNCPSLDGVELEDENGKENMTHWSQRILLGDYMISEFYYSEQAISEITLALLEDLGYYKVNYYTGGLMRFGKHRGCEFLDNDCIQQQQQGTGNIKFVKSSFPNEFCSSIYYEGLDLNYGLCSPGRQSMSYCYNREPSSILSNTKYRRSAESDYFLYTGYSDKTLIEYCPISYDVNRESNENPRIFYGGNCKYGNKKYGQSLTFWKGVETSQKFYSTISDIIEEEYSGESFCVFSSLLNKNNNNPNYIKNILRPTCYEMSCSEKSLTIIIGSEYIVCPRAGGIIKLESNYSNYTGFLICPDYNLICTGTVICNIYLKIKDYELYFTVISLIVLIKIRFLKILLLIMIIIKVRMFLVKLKIVMTH